MATYENLQNVRAEFDQLAGADFSVITEKFADQQANISGEKAPINELKSKLICSLKTVTGICLSESTQTENKVEDNEAYRP